MLLFSIKQMKVKLKVKVMTLSPSSGKTWERHVEGQKLKADGDSFRQKLNTQQLFEDWQAKVILCFIPHIARARSFDFSCFPNFIDT